MSVNDDMELGDCFKIAADMTVPIMGIVSDHLQGLKNVTLVHGIVSGQGPIDGFWFTHAWVEGVTADGIKMVIDASNGRPIVMPQVLYYLIGQIDERVCERYRPETAKRRMIEYAHYGPWDGAPASHIDPTLSEIAGKAVA
jgi:hypothetical protein